ncbi:ricin-type beta-trefoil lectin domain protein [Streptomyces sp. WMMC940]|uniref:ricin-type beta-trefoil lectin domain protein n=1 Tax=Streptomyces sp. WMMC940 TaxID=3015153 RepID=UPI0022B746DD|nr:ricin-type beta-trefoil lectin domain protein [Streptomyces sp. WMMC940]MCZ7460227.1 ricin-type beta-trefoil lectin domain protein [Streptomyces sp. WMMC940]
MPRLQKVGSTTVSWGGGRAEPTDTELAERIRSRGAAGHSPEDELKQRHLSYAVICAQLCTRGRTAADRLAHEALERAAEAARSGIDPFGTWRHFVLTHVHHTARSWARTGRRALLRPSFLTWADDHGEGGGGRPDGTPAESWEKQTLRNGFFALPEVARGVLWYSLVDQEPDERVATYVGVAPDVVPALRAKARKTLRDAFLQAHAERAGDTRCNGFRRLVEAAAVADDSPHCGDLALHLDTCLACEGLLTQLILLSDDLRTALADGLLDRDGAAYASAVVQGRHTSDSAPPPSGGAESGYAGEHPGPAHGAAHARRPPRRGARVAGAVAAVAAVSVPLLLIAARHSGEETGADRGEGRPSASAAAPSNAATGPTQPGAGSTVPPGDLDYGRIVHKGSGLCMDIEDGVLTKRGGAVAAPCTQALTQQWALDAQGRLHNRDDPTFCLKADGDGAGVGIRPCSSDNPEKLDKMAFLVEPAGAIRPKSAPTVALVPDPEWVESPVPLELRSVDDRSDQRWTVESLASATRGGATDGP